MGGRTLSFGAAKAIHDRNAQGMAMHRVRADRPPAAMRRHLFGLRLTGIMPGAEKGRRAR